MPPNPSAPPRPVGPDPDDTRAGRRLMVGLLVVFFGLMLLANGAIVYVASQHAPRIEPSYQQERR